MNRSHPVRLLSPLLCCLLSAGVVHGAPAGGEDDWPQWRGPRRDGTWAETGLVERFEGESREVFAARHEVLKATGIAAGDIVADIGAGRVGELLHTDRTELGKLIRREE